jgi:hypothetical protein
MQRAEYRADGNKEGNEALDCRKKTPSCLTNGVFIITQLKN